MIDIIFTSIRNSYPRCSIWFLIFFFPISFTVAQHYNNHFVERIMPEDGLISPYIYTIFQDKRGFIWIGTSEGLQRFDGKTFKNYFATRKDLTSSILDHNVMDVNQDPQGNIWIGTKEGGISMLDVNTEKFIHFNSRTHKEFIPENNIVWWNSSVIDDEENIWYGTSGGLACINTKTLKTKIYRSDNSNLIYNEISVVLKSHQKHLLWVAGADGISLFDTKKGVFYHRKNNPHQLAVFETKNYVPDLVTEGVAILNAYYTNGKLWIATHDSGNWVYDITTNQLQQLRLTDKPPLIYYFLQRGDDMLMATTIGLVEYNIPSKKIISIQQNAIQNPHSLPSSGLNQIILDKQQNYWIATQNGIGRIRAKEDRLSFTSLPNNDNPNDAHVFISSIAQLPDGTIMAGSSKGIYALDSQLRLIKHYSFNKKKALSNAYILSMTATKEGNLMAVTNEGILYYDHKRKQFDDFGDIKGLTLRYFISCFQENESVFWLGVGIWNNAIMRLDLKKRVMEAVPFTPNPWDRNRAIRIWHAPKGKLNVLNDKGIFIFDPQRRVFEKLYVLDKQYPTEVYLDITPIDQKYYVKLANGGFGIFDTITQKMERYSRENGLLSDDVTGFVKDNAGYIWILTNNGLSKFNHTNKTFINFSHKDGLHGMDFKTIIKLRSGELLIGNQTYLIKLKPEKLIADIRIPAPVFTDCQIGDTYIPIGALEKEITINHNKNFFSVGYASLYYANSQAVKYAYQMEGYDKDWRIVNNKNSAIYTNLDGGHYTFKVKAAHKDGTWNENIATIKLFVTTPFYRTWWFLGLIILGLAGFFYGLYRYRLSQILKLQRVRNSISRDLHDEVGSALSSISMLSASTKAAFEKDPERGKMLIDMIGTNTQKILEDMDDIVWAVSPEKDDSQHIVLRMQDYLNTLSETNKVAIKFVQYGEVEGLKLTMFVRRNVYLIFKEAVNNALKHAQATWLEITLSRKPNEMVLEVIDNGMGFDTNRPSLRNGLNNMRQRATEIDGQIEIKSSKTGTQLVLQVPV